MGKKTETILVTGGAGYIGSVLIPKLLNKGYRVKCLDLYIYGDDVLGACRYSPALKEIKGDIRDQDLLNKELAGVDAVIHLACISNDPSFELNPQLGKSINFDAFGPLVDIAKTSGVKRFIYASSTSVYGIKDIPDVTEDLALEPLTDYSRYKADCERVLLEKAEDGFAVCIIRPATVCGYSPRLRLDLTVNILTNLAINNGVITVFGGEQKRPNIHIEDITDLYVRLLELPAGQIDRKIYNAGYENYKVKEIAAMVKRTIGDKRVEIKTTPTDDNRSYHVCSARIKRELGFEPKHSIEEAIKDLKDAFENHKIPNSLNDNRYFNIKKMQEIKMR